MVHTENGFGIVQFYLILNEGMGSLLMGNGRVNGMTVPEGSEAMLWGRADGSFIVQICGSEGNAIEP